VPSRRANSSVGQRRQRQPSRRWRGTGSEAPLPPPRCRFCGARPHFTHARRTSRSSPKTQHPPRMARPSRAISSASGVGSPLMTGTISPPQSRHRLAARAPVDFPMRPFTCRWTSPLGYSTARNRRSSRSSQVLRRRPRRLKRLDDFGASRSLSSGGWACFSRARSGPAFFDAAGCTRIERSAYAARGSFDVVRSARPGSGRRAGECDDQ
jgi:hypothetical protein